VKLIFRLLILNNSEYFQGLNKLNQMISGYKYNDFEKNKKPPVKTRGW